MIGVVVTNVMDTTHWVVDHTPHPVAQAVVLWVKAPAIPENFLGYSFPRCRNRRGLMSPAMTDAGPILGSVS